MTSNFEFLLFRHVFWLGAFFKNIRKELQTSKSTSPKVAGSVCVGGVDCWSYCSLQFLKCLYTNNY